MQTTMTGGRALARNLRAIAQTTLLALVLLLALPGLAAAQGRTIIVSAEGLADPNADAYKRDKALMVEDLRRDARKQAVEKAVGALVSSSTLIENYTLIHDRILSRTAGMIKSVIKESPPWIGEDGFAHMLIKAEVYLDDVQNALQEMSRDERVALIKERGNPKISTSIRVQSADSPGAGFQRSGLAENILNERIKGFGYRVWSEDHSTKLKTDMMVRSKLQNQVEATISLQSQRAADFYITGEAKLTTSTQTLQPANITVTLYLLNHFSVKCVNAHTGEEILYNNQVPKGRSWPNEAQAIESIGQLIGEEFSQDFFVQHLQAPSQIYQLQVLGLPSYDMGQLLRKEFIGLRPVLNIDFRNFDRNGASLYEVEFSGSDDNFNQLLNSAVLQPLNQKLGENAFKLDSAHGNTVQVVFEPVMSEQELTKRLQGSPPASLATAHPERIKEIVKSEETLQKVAEVAPDVARKLDEDGILDSAGGQSAVESF